LTGFTFGDIQGKEGLQGNQVLRRLVSFWIKLLTLRPLPGQGKPTGVEEEGFSEAVVTCHEIEAGGKIRFKSLQGANVICLDLTDHFTLW
jgi:hypothetical protein